MVSFTNLSAKTRGILWQVWACFAAACVVVIVRTLSASLHPLQIVFFAMFLGLLWIIPWLKRENKLLPERRLLGWYAARAVASLLGMSLSYYSYQQMPLPLATSLSFTIPIFASVFAMFFFRERIDWMRFLALMTAFGGVLVIARPGSEDFNRYALLMIVSSALIATSILIIKRLTVDDRPRQIIFYSLLLMTPFSFIIALPFWQPVTLAHIPWLMGLGFFFAMQQIAGAWALARADVVLIMAFDYLRLVFVAAMAYMLFSEVLTLWTIVGSLIILGSALFALQRERRFARNMPPS